MCVERVKCSKGLNGDVQTSSACCRNGSQMGVVKRKQENEGSLRSHSLPFHKVSLAQGTAKVLVSF